MSIPLGYRFTLLLLVAAVVVASPVQGQAKSSSLHGKVFDEIGRPVVGASVILSRPVGSFQRVTQTNGEGAFQFSDLKVGSYRVTASSENYAAAVQILTLQERERKTVDLNLQPDPSAPLYERIMVIGDSHRVNQIPGSAHFLSESDLRTQKQGFDDINRVLRQVPGINIQEEECFGLRPNIGMRGSGVERSSKITLMEDGVLIAPAPYAASGSEYFPMTGRMRALEVRKGSSQIKYGPRTSGGVINFMSTEIPQDFLLDGKLGGGLNSARQGHVSLGDSYQNYGWLLETYQLGTDGFKELDGGGNTGFQTGDYLGKFRFNTSPDSGIYHQVDLKVGYTKQNSDETYLGLSDADFAANPDRRYAGSQLDNLFSQHEMYQARHFIALPSGFDVTTVVYRNNYSSDWYRVESVSGAPVSDILANPIGLAFEMDILRGAADSAGDTIALRANNRGYYSQGVQSVLGMRRDGANTSHAFEFGFRFHEDQEDRFQHEDGYQMVGGVLSRTSPGIPGSQANLVNDARALSFFAQDQIRQGRWTLVPGVRYETIDLTRSTFSTADPTRSGSPGTSTSTVNSIIPGIGINFDAGANVRVFGGVHKGFSPPGPGAGDEIDPEESANYEIGARLRQGLLRTHVAAFYSDYTNLLAVDTRASGGTGTGEIFNGGRAKVLGLEASAHMDLAETSDLPVSVPFQFSYTFTDGQFRDSFSSGFDPWGFVEQGDFLPYLPRHQFYARLGIGTSRWSAGVDGNFVGSMRTQAGQGGIPDLQRIGQFTVFNLSGEYGLTRAANLFVNVQNLANNRYLVSRRPAGLRPGLPRFFMGGIKFRIGSGR